MDTNLADRTDNHEYATKAKVGTNGCCTVTASTAPSHECASEGSQGQKEADKCSISTLASEIESSTRHMNIQWSRVTECLTELASNSVLR